MTANRRGATRGPRDARRSPARTPAAWSVYLLECADGTLYCGISNDVDARIAAHNAGKGARYTRGRTPVRLVWREECGTRGAALRRELQVKALRRDAKQRLIHDQRT